MAAPSSTPPSDIGPGPKTNDSDSTTGAATVGPKKFPKGIVLGPDGKPCRSCSSFAAWASMTKSQTGSGSTTTTTAATVSPPSSQPQSSTSTSTSTSTSKTATMPCPPDVDALGSSTWTLLHTMAATYPETAPPSTQRAARNFISSLAELYPCWSCASEFKSYISRDETTRPKVGGRAEFGWWMCLAHNDVNRRLGKEEFDCNRWEERWAAKGREREC